MYTDVEFGIHIHLWVQIHFEFFILFFLLYFWQ